MRRRECLLTLGAVPALWSPARAETLPTAVGERVVWPSAVPLLDGGLWPLNPGDAHVVVFWSTTCPFCQRHNQHVEKLHRALAGRRATVLGAARDSDPALVQRTVAARGYTFPVTLAWRELAAVLSTRNMIPLTAVVDREGRLRQVIAGEMFEEDVLELAHLAG